MRSKVKDIIDIIENVDEIYPGDLKYYFAIVFIKAKNILNFYHNLTHIFHVLWVGYQACLYYHNKLSPREIRNLLIAILFHDFNHSGVTGNDENEINRAIEALKKYILSQDKHMLRSIIRIIEASKWPIKVIQRPTLSEQIMRDCDLSQALCQTWMQQVIFGLGKEMGKSQIEMLEMQTSFLLSISFNTLWAKKQFPSSLIRSKIRQVERILKILKQNPLPIS